MRTIYYRVFIQKSLSNGFWNLAEDFFVSKVTENKGKSLYISYKSAINLEKTNVFDQFT